MCISATSSEGFLVIHARTGGYLVSDGHGFVCSCVCALQCAQLLHTILHRTDLIISLLIIIIIIIIIIINDNVYGAVIVTVVTARVHPVHLMNAD